jgi:uncharacterized protein (TIRG00374 family)
MRKIFIVLAFFVGIAIIFVSFGELENTWKTLQRSDFRFLFLAILLQVAWLVNDAAGYRSLYLLMDVCESMRHLALLSSATNFINVVAPSGGFGGIAIFVDDAGKRNLPRGLAAAVAALYLFLDYAAFLGVLGLGIIVLMRRNDLNPAELTASVIMTILVAIFGILIYIGSQSGERLARVLSWMAHQINRMLWRFIRREYFREVGAYEFALEVAEGLSILRYKRRKIIIPFLHAVNGKVIQTAILWMTFLSFDVPYSTGTVIAGFATAYLFLVMSPTPSGIGVVEGILPLALTSLGVPWEQAVVVTLTYRGLTFWFPLLVGGVAFRILQKE